MESYPWKIALEHFNNKKSVHSGRLKHHMLFAVKAVNLKKKTHKKTTDVAPTARSIIIA